ncbi:chorismate-binding protein [Negadavirga shengliensis]|uniref:Chorismate-binding protein n=1 Tax=Negadavirga shengliensis TaxID=1389218 RepID=A0ABV9T3L4_9BACT
MDAAIEKTLLTKEQYLEVVIYKALTENHQIAVWRKPKQNLVEVIIDSQPETQQVNPDLENLPAGFLIHPFLGKKDGKSYFIQAESYFSFLLNDETPFEEEQAFGNTPASRPEGFKDILRKKLMEKNPSRRDLVSTPKEDFLKMVEEAVAVINSGNMYKVVPARIKKMTLGATFDIALTFLKLCEAYPNAFVNFFHTSESGSWFGASPETLIETKGDLFYTMSLAGTQQATGNNPLKTAAWTQKEIEEQALVSRYIVNCFKKIRLREYEEIGPKTTIAGGLLHLKSDFRVDMKATNFPQLGSVMLELLHPTSAVCGMPKESALEFIQKHEKFDRSFFSGYIGPVNIGEETSIFVNLRCAQLQGGDILLYAGAGVTEDSVPEKEWKETEMKCDIIGKFINSTDSV